MPTRHGLSVAPSTPTLLTQWNWAPSVILGLLVLVGVYFYAVGPLRRRRNLGPPPSRAHVCYFSLSVVVLVFSLLSPLDPIGDEYLFSVHMGQHLLLATLWPVLFLLGIPSWLVDHAFRRPWIRGIVGAMTYPAVAVIAFNVDVYAWHLPALYDLTLRNEAVHILEHLTFMAFGVLVWWPILNPIREQRLPYPLQILYLFLSGMFMMGLGILFTFSPVVFYSPYASAPRLWDVSAATDQQIGGLIMWYPGNLPYALALIFAFFRWFDGGQPARPKRQRIQSPTIGPPVP